MPPFLSLVLAVDRTGFEALGRTVASVSAQAWTEWELLVYPASDDVLVDELRAVIGQADRIQVLDTTGSAVDRAQQVLEGAQGEFFCVLPRGAEVEPDGLPELQRLAATSPGLDLVYTDEAEVTADGTREIVRKPAWSPERLRGHSYMGHLVALRTSLAREVGGFGEQPDGAHELDLLLRASEVARSVVRVPVVGVSRPEGSQAPDEAGWRTGLASVQQHLDRVGIEARAALGPVLGTYRIERRLPPEVSVSVVIATEGQRGLAWGEHRSYVVEAARSVLADVVGRSCEVVVVHNQNTPVRVLEELRALGGRVRAISYVGPFNSARMSNRGVAVSGGQIVVLLDERTEISSPDFIGQLAAPLLDRPVRGPLVGLTGPCALASDGSVLGGGLALFQDLYEPMFRGALPAEGTEPALVVNRECSGLAATCLALTREVFEEVGGLNERHQKSAHVDLAMKIDRLGLRRLWVANATLRHFPPPGRADRVPRRARHWLGSRWTGPDLDPFDPTHGARQLQRAQRQAEELTARWRAERARARSS